MLSFRWNSHKWFIKILPSIFFKCETVGVENSKIAIQILLKGRDTKTIKVTHVNHDAVDKAK